jgi:homeobox protein Unc-4
MKNVYMLVLQSGPGRPAHNAHPQSCSGEPIPPDEIVKRDKEKRERKLRKQLERQVKRLQQSKLKPGVNMSALTDAIHQSLTELRTINSAKEAKDLVGSETYMLLVETLNIDVIDILRKVIPVAQGGLHNNRLSSSHSHSHSHSQNKSSAFSIENLLSTRAYRQTCNKEGNRNNDITQPVGFLVTNNSSPSFHDDDSNSSNDSSVDSEFMSPHHEWATSSPELDVTDDSRDYNETTGTNCNNNEDGNAKDLSNNNNCAT